MRRVGSKSRVNRMENGDARKNVFGVEAFGVEHVAKCDVDKSRGDGAGGTSGKGCAEER